MTVDDNTSLVIPDRLPGGLVSLAAQSEHLIQTPYVRYLLSQNTSSHYTLKSTLKRLSEILFNSASPESAPWESVQAYTVELLVFELKKLKYTPKTCNRYLSVLRGIVSKARELGLITADEYQNIKLVKGRFGSIQTKGRALSDDEVDTIFDDLSSDKSMLGVRDMAIIATYIACGIRRAELVSIDLNHINFRDQSFVVCGKGSKERIVPMIQGLDKLILEWVDGYRGEEPGPLFCAIQNTAEQIRRDVDGSLKRLSPRTINDIVYKRLLCLSEPATPHDFRRTFAERRINNKVDIKTLQDLLGHSTITTTSLYLKDKKRMFESANQDQLLNKRAIK